MISFVLYNNKKEIETTINIDIPSDIFLQYKIGSFLHDYSKKLLGKKIYSHEIYMWVSDESERQIIPLSHQWINDNFRIDIRNFFGLQKKKLC